MFTVALDTARLRGLYHYRVSGGAWPGVARVRRGGHTGAFVSRVIVQGFIEVPESDLAAVVSALPGHVELTRKEQGCLAFRVERDPRHRHRFAVYEEFTSAQAFEEHQARVKASHWGRVAKNVRRHYKIETQ